VNQDGVGGRAIGWCLLETHHDTYPARTMTSGTDGLVSDDFNNHLRYKDLSMNAQNKPQAFELNYTKGRTYWGMGILWTMLATAEDTDGKYSCTEEPIPHGPSAAPHIHEVVDESLYIIEGEMTFFIEDRPLKAIARSFVSVSKGYKTRFSN
jgi:mannose-6-phosphate isomerase-like protein (cupin superfamily)